MTLRYFSTQLSTLAEIGYAEENALSVLGMTPAQLTRAHKRLPLEQVEAVYRDAAEKLSDPWIALRVGYKFRVPTYAQTGMMYNFCQNLAHIIEMNRKYQKLSVDAARVTHDVDNGRHFLSLTPHKIPHNLPHVLLMIMGAYGSSFQWLSWETGKEIKAVYFDIPKTQDTSLCESIFRCPVYFGQNQSRLEFYEDTIYAPLSTANPEKLALAVAKLEGLLHSQNEALSFTQAAQSSIKAALTMGQVSLPIVAGRLEMTERQLRQKLKLCGVTYSELLEQVRRAAFQDLFARGESFAAISQYLGYNDQSAFNRAFKRWHDMSPTQYTKIMQRAPEGASVF